MKKSASPVELLDWDTAFWGVRVARIASGPGRVSDVTAADTWCQEHGVAVGFLFASIEHLELVDVATPLGFRCMDLQETLSCDRSYVAEANRSMGGSIRDAVDADLMALEHIAGSAHRDSRFYADPGFDDRRCAELYRTWIRNSCHGWADFVLVAEADGVAIGYATGHQERDRGRIGLVGVHERWRGRGVGAVLVGSAVSRLVKAGCTPIEVTTQGRNLAAQHLYARLGFIANGFGIWLHKWY